MQRAPLLGAGVVRGRGQGSSRLVITLVMSLELSTGDIGKAAGGNAVLTPSLAIGVGCPVRGVATTGCFLAMTPELYVRGVGEVTVGVVITPELSVWVVKRCALKDEAPSLRLPSRFSFREVDGRATGLFSPVL